MIYSFQIFHKASKHRGAAMQLHTHTNLGIHISYTFVPELAFEVVEDRGALVFTGASGACSEGLPLRVKELIAHLHSNCEFQFNTDRKFLKGRCRSNMITMSSNCSS